MTNAYWVEWVADRKTLVRIIEVTEKHTEVKILEGNFKGKVLIVSKTNEGESIQNIDNVDHTIEKCKPVVKTGKIISVKRQEIKIYSLASGKDVNGKVWTIEIDETIYYLEEAFAHNYSMNGHKYPKIIKLNGTYIADNITDAKRNLISKHMRNTA